MSREFYIVVGVVAALFGPFITIWSINTLFSTNIVYDFYSWCAIFWLQLMFISRNVGKE